jgi:class 3 adenylate cyclase
MACTPAPAAVTLLISRRHGSLSTRAVPEPEFDGPARAIRPALEIAERVAELGIEIHAGVHTGECELIDRKAAGLTVSINARLAVIADASEVLVSAAFCDSCFEPVYPSRKQGPARRRHIRLGGS